jgi:hypothetical protein
VPGAIHALSVREHQLIGRITMSRSAWAVVAAVAATALVPAVAAAQPAVHYHSDYAESFDEVVCGVAVVGDIVQSGNFIQYADGTVRATMRSRLTMTNPLNGATVVVSFAGASSDPAPVIDEAAGTITFHPVISGLTSKVQTQGGSVLLLDAGLLTWADTYDLDTGAFLSSELTVIKGPHPAVESNYTRTCEVIAAALA